MILLGIVQLHLFKLQVDSNTHINKHVQIQSNNPPHPCLTSVPTLVTGRSSEVLMDKPKSAKHTGWQATVKVQG